MPRAFLVLQGAAVSAVDVGPCQLSCVMRRISCGRCCQAGDEGDNRSGAATDLSHADQHQSAATQAAIASIAVLPRGQAEIVMLRVVVGDVSYVAQIVGKTSVAVRVAVHRGRRRLAGQVERRRQHPAGGSRMTRMPGSSPAWPARRAAAGHDLGAAPTPRSAASSMAWWLDSPAMPAFTRPASQVAPRRCPAVSPAPAARTFSSRTLPGSR